MPAPKRAAARAGPRRRRSATGPADAARGATALTFDALADLYIEKYAKPQKASWKNDAGYLRHARRVWGKRKAGSITKQDAAKLLFDVVAVAPVSANRLRSVLVKLFGWAATARCSTDNPMLGVKKPHREGEGQRPHPA